MALTNLFRINLPYGMKRNSKGEWSLFNREYLPLGWNELSDASHDPRKEKNVYVSYKGITEKYLLRLIKNQESFIHRDSSGIIEMIFFYKDGTIPTENPKNWTNYIRIIKSISKLERK